MLSIMLAARQIDSGEFIAYLCDGDKLVTKYGTGYGKTAKEAIENARKIKERIEKNEMYPMQNK